MALTLTTLSLLTLSVPVNAICHVKVRVISKGIYNPSVCETDFDGEVEDYSFIDNCSSTFHGRRQRAQ